MSPLKPAIAVDAMGGDHAPGEIVAGALLAAQESACDIHLVGKIAELEKALSELGQRPNNIILHNASTLIAMHESPLPAVTAKPDASINRCMQLLAEGSAQSVVSAGNSGATVASAILIVKRTRGVSRPALLSTIQLPGGRQLALLDVGANVKNSAKQLCQFATLGKNYAYNDLGIKEPRIALLNHGHEAYKGTRTILAADQKLQFDMPHYIGFIEGNQLFKGVADVVVCNGFIGNILLKSLEGLADLIADNVHELPGSWQKFMHYRKKAGAILLGVRRPVYVCHGNATRETIAATIENAFRLTKET